MRFRASILVLALTLIPVSCGKAKGPITVGAVYPTAGGQGEGGLEELHGVQLAAAYVNQTGGVRGSRVAIRVEAANSREAAPLAVRRLVNRGVKVLVGSYGSTISKPAVEEATKSGALFWETGAIGLLPMTEEGNVFRFAPTGKTLGQSSVRFIADQLAGRIGKEQLRYSVVYVDDDYGRSVGQGAIDEIERSGLKLAGKIPYSLATADYPAIAKQIADAHTDVLVVSSYIEDAIEMRKEVLAEKVPLVASIGTSSSYCMPAFGDRLGPQAVGLFASDKPDGDVVAPKALSSSAEKVLEWARKRYRQDYHDDMSAPALSGFSAGLALFGHAMRDAKQVSPNAIAKAALRLDLPTGSLPNGAGIKFGRSKGSSAADNLRASHVIWEWTRPGVRAVVWPPAFATDPIELLPIS